MKINISAVLFVIMFGLQSYSQNKSQSKLALNWKAESEFGGFYEAQIKGHYKNQKLDIEILEGGSGTPTTQMLMNGTVDYAIVSAEEILLSAERDPKRRIVAVFAVFESSPYIIMAHEKFQNKKLADLFKDKTQTISLQKGLPYVEFLIKKYAPVQAKLVPYQGGIGAFQTNKNMAQQGFITSEALIAEQKEIKTKTWLVSEEGFNPYLTVLAVREADLKNNPEQIKKMVEATRQGWLGYLKSPSEMNTLMSLKNPAMSAEMMRLSLERMQPLMKFEPLLLGQMRKERWDKLQKQMLDLKLIKKSEPTQELFQNL